jgi:hypothetical protein
MDKLTSTVGAATGRLTASRTPVGVREVLRTWTQLTPSAPDELMTWCSLMQFPDLPFVPEHVRGGSFAVVLGAYLGDEPAGRELLRGVRDLGPAMDTFAMVPPAALRELAMSPVPLPLMTTTAQIDAVPVDELVAAPAPGRDRRSRSWSCGRWAARSRAPSRTPAPERPCQATTASSPSWGTGRGGGARWRGRGTADSRSR